MKLSLVVVNAAKATGQTIPIKTPQFIIGRDPDCNLRPASAVISKKHCALLVKGGKVTLKDYESTNGTSLNDQPVKGEVEVANGDTLKVGPLTFKVVIEQTVAPSKPTPLPKPAVKISEEEDAAALLLSLDDGTISAPTDPEAVDVPGGSTVMDMPSFNNAQGEAGETPKPTDKKKDEKPKPAHDSASSAAAALIDKMRKGARK